MLNKLLGGHYLVVENLEEGGLSQTYIAEDQHRPGCPKCAVKFLKPASDDAQFLPNVRRLFKQEAEILEKLGQHDQIPRLLAYFEENQQFYLVQELIDGHNLSKELARGQSWPESKVLKMLEDVLLILEFVHSYGVIHRDIKPSNLIRRQQDDRLVLIDFGAVKQVSAPGIGNNFLFSQKTIAIGTKGYMPTEQMRGKPRLNSDIYALGMIGIQALTGVYPIDLEEDAEGEIIWQDMAEVSDGLAAIISQMTRYHFKDRYQSVTEVLQELQSLAGENSFMAPELETEILELAPEPELEKQEVASTVDESLTSKQETHPEIKDISTTKSVFATDSAKISERVNHSRKWLSTLMRPHKSQLLIGTGITSVLVGVLAGYSHINESHLQAEQALGQIEELKTNAQYQECLQQAQIFPQDYNYFHSEVANLQSQCQQAQAEAQLTQAKKLAQQSKLRDAIAQAQSITSDQVVYDTAQQLIAQWSQEILKIANNKYQEGNLAMAIAIAQAVPGDSSLAPKAAETIKHWQEQWQQNQNYLATAQQQLNAGSWQEAIQTAKKLEQTDYWQGQSQPIIQQAQAKINAAQAAAAQKKRAPQPVSQATPPRSPRVTNSRPNIRTTPTTPRPQLSDLRNGENSQTKLKDNPTPKPRYTSRMTCKYGRHPIKCRQ